MTFEIQNQTAKIASITTRIEKHGDEDVPAVSLGLRITGPNTLLDLMQPGLREVLYKAVDDQEALPGVDAPTPLLRTRCIEKFPVKMPDMVGWQLVIENGIDDESAIDLHDCKVDKFVAEPFEGGSCEISFRVGTSDIDEAYAGRLAMKLGREVPISLVAPQAKPDAIDGTVAAFEADHPGEPDAGDLFAEEHGGGPRLAEEVDA